MFRFLAVMIFTVLPWTLWAAATEKECKDKAAACAKANNCAKKPDSKECKACQAEYEKCVADTPAARAAKKKRK
jgi:hypothetical protein